MKRQSMICEFKLLFTSSILAVRLNRNSLVVVLEMEIYVHNISDMRLLHFIETRPNPEAICTLSPSADSSYLAYPSPVPSPTTAANASPSTAVASSSASASSQHQPGDVLLFSTRTVIRVWSIPQPALKNNNEASNLNQSSSSPPESVEGASPPPSLEGGYESFIEKKKSKSISSGFDRRSLQLTKSLTHSMGGYLPNLLTEMWEPSRDFAFLPFPTSGTRSIVAFSGTMPHVMVISSDDYFYSYSIDLERGGECSLMKQYSLLDSGEESSVLDGK
ncbi:hypothetical protein BYT27DRAFT_7254366 [Phlegmacium glaucopus]|nr:hypothetical protein BYT27DRAFT_7254366 [Phlegmacium glaucopus]